VRTMGTPRSGTYAPSTRPTAPAAPHTAAMDPSCSGQCRTNPPAVTPACARLAPTSKLRGAWRKDSICAGARTKVAHDPGTAVQQTRVPGVMSTPSPTAATVPEPSKPTLYGNGNRTEYVPDRTRVST